MATFKPDSAGMKNLEDSLTKEIRRGPTLVADAHDGRGS